MKTLVAAPIYAFLLLTATGALAHNENVMSSSTWASGSFAVGVILPPFLFAISVIWQPVLFAFVILGLGTWAIQHLLLNANRGNSHV